MGAGMEVVVGRHAGQSQGVGSMSGDTGAFPECKVYTLITHHAGAQLWVGSSRNWSVFLEWPYHGTSRKGSGSLSMQPFGCTPCCSSEALRRSSIVHHGDDRFVIKKRDILSMLFVAVMSNAHEFHAGRMFSEWPSTC